jgi:hypothetical protein
MSLALQAQSPAIAVDVGEARNPPMARIAAPDDAVLTVQARCLCEPLPGHATDAQQQRVDRFELAVDFRCRETPCPRYGPPRRWRQANIDAVGTVLRQHMFVQLLTGGEVLVVG